MITIICCFANLWKFLQLKEIQLSCLILKQCLRVVIFRSIDQYYSEAILSSNMKHWLYADNYSHSIIKFRIFYRFNVPSTFICNIFTVEILIFKMINYYGNENLMWMVKASDWQWVSVLKMRGTTKYLKLN